MTYEEFVIAFEPINVFNKEFETAHNALSALCPSSFPTLDLGGHLLDAYISLLSTMVDDTINDWVAWYVWENDCGKKGFEVSWTDNNLKEIKFKVNNLKDLWDVIHSISS